MNVIIKKIFFLLGLFSLIICPRFACRLIRWISDKIYAARLTIFFKSAQNLCVSGRPIKLTGTKYMNLGKNVILNAPMRMEAIDSCNGQHYEPKIVLGDNVHINAYCHIGCINEICIGQGTVISERTLIVDHMHGNTSLQQLQMHTFDKNLYSKGKIVIGRNVHIGEGSVILPDVFIGNNCVIGANSVVTKNIPDFSVAVGNPAKIIKIVSERC